MLAGTGGCRDKFHRITSGKVLTNKLLSKLQRQACVNSYISGRKKVGVLASNGIKNYIRSANLHEKKYLVYKYTAFILKLPTVRYFKYIAPVF